MPQSMTIAAFGLGAVLLLIAILHGGGFKIFGVEVDGLPGRFGRVFAASQQQSKSVVITRRQSADPFLVPLLSCPTVTK